MTPSARNGRMGCRTDLASPVVQVVTSGVDWPAVAAAIAGGVVGLAGIIFAWRQSKMTISAEDARATLAEKRRIYANYLAAIAQYQRLSAIAGDDDTEDAFQELQQARMAARLAFQEVILISSTSLGILSQDSGGLEPERADQASIDIPERHTRRW